MSLGPAHLTPSLETCMMEKWADRNLLMFSRGNCDILHLGKNDSTCQDVLGHLECTGKAVRVLVVH